jgi:molybdopterin synthase catalytic subunit
MQIRVLLFATLRDLVGQREIQISLPDRAYNLDDIRKEIVRLYPQVEANMRVALAAINGEFAATADPVQDRDEIAFFPPVSGGAPHYPEIFRLPYESFDHDEVIAAITIPETGAVCLFTGIVRGATAREGHIPETEFLEYEAYEAMAISKMKQVAMEIRERWSLVQGIAIIQRLGKLAVGENTVLIACSSAHRDDGCFEAARYGIDRLKEIVPVWKKEIGVAGERWIEGNYIPGTDDQSKDR